MKIFIFSGWLLRSLQCGRRQWQESMTVYRQQSSYTSNNDSKSVWEETKHSIAGADLLFLVCFSFSAKWRLFGGGKCNVTTIMLAECLLVPGSILWWEKKRWAGSTPNTILVEKVDFCHQIVPLSLSFTLSELFWHTLTCSLTKILLSANETVWRSSIFIWNKTNKCS